MLEYPKILQYKKAVKIKFVDDKKSFKYRVSGTSGNKKLEILFQEELYISIVAYQEENVPGE